MKEFLKHLLMMPRSLRTRMFIAFALMGVIPILSAVYVISLYPQSVRERPTSLSVLLLMCILLTITGFIVMKMTIFGIIDISRLVDQLLIRSQRRGAKDVSPREIIRVERLVSYMDDQLFTARRLLDSYREVRREGAKPFRLPALVPQRSLHERIETELALAAEDQYPIGLFTWKADVVTLEESQDESLMPPWLQDMLKRSGASFSALGRLAPGYWIGWMQKKNAGAIKQFEAKMHEVMKHDTHGITIKVWCHPAEQFSAAALFAPLEGGRRRW